MSFRLWITWISGESVAVGEESKRWLVRIVRVRRKSWPSKCIKSVLIYGRDSKFDDWLAHARHEITCHDFLYSSFIIEYSLHPLTSIHLQNMLNSLIWNILHTNDYFKRWKKKEWLTFEWKEFFGRTSFQTFVSMFSVRTSHVHTKLHCSKVHPISDPNQKVLNNLYSTTSAIQCFINNKVYY